MGDRPVSGTAGPPRSRLGRSLGRYLARSLAAPTAVALAGLGAAFLTKSLLQWSDLIVNRGLGPAAVGVLALHQLVPVIAQVLPFGLLIGILAGIGHLRATGELLAIEAAGVSPRWLVKPVAAFAGATTVVGLVLSLWLAPASRAARLESLREMLAAHPGATLAAGAVHAFGDHLLTAREVSSRGDELRGVVLWSPELGETLFAERASLTPDGQGGIELELHDATALLGPGSGGGQIAVGSFRTALVPDSDLGDPADRLESASPAEVWRLAYGDGDGEGGAPADARTARLAAAELHRRVALPCAGLVLGLAAVPLALRGRRSSRTAGAVLGLGLTVAYYGLLQVGNGLLRDPSVPVWAAIWLPNLLGAVAAGALLAGPRMAGGAGLYDDRDRGGTRGASLRIPVGGSILPRYVASIFVQTVFLCFGALLVGYLLVDVLERLQWFARHEATAREAIRFYGARTPLLMSRVGPPSLLAAASLTVSQLETRGELIAMQACGLSRLRALAPITAVALLAVPVYFFVTDSVVPRTNALADHLKATEIKGGEEGDETSHFVWYRVGGNLLQASRMNRGDEVARDVTIYELDARGFPTSRIDAAEARHVGDGEWELVDPRRVSISGFGVTEMEAAPRIQLGGVEELDTMHLGVRGLAREIERARADGYDTTVFEVDLQTRLAAPFACVLLPLLAVMAAVAGPGRASPAQRGRGASRSLMLAAALAVGFILLGDVSRSLGYGARVAPVVAAWAPMALLLAASAWLARLGRY